MPISEEDKALVKNLHLFKSYGLRVRVSKKKLHKESLNVLLRKLCETGSTSSGSGRPKRACTEENVTAVEELVVSQEDKHQTHRST